MSQRDETPPDGRLGVVVIGRNEGERLMSALASIGPIASAVVYADSASTDGSVEQVREQFPHVHVVVLDTRRPLNPARGRNAGFSELLRVLPGVELVQFLDGDCTLAPGWLDSARRRLEESPDVGIVCGRLRERERQRNRYHRLADMEWAQPPGEVDDLGGIMMIRRELWQSVGGQNADIPAAEERELCRRAIAAGWKALRLPDDMALHDIDMDRFGQWWERMVRMGHSWAQGLWIHRDSRHLRQVASLVLWGAVLPAFILGAAMPTVGVSLALLLAYGHLWLRIVADREARGDRRDDARLFASAMLTAKLAGAVGVVRFLGVTLPSGRGGRRA
ncbi:MAG: glycosyltransferase [Myxococcaceae bacterium]|nr:glycosyltransferase [Myxococcaceae bacterium]